MGGSIGILCLHLLLELRQQVTELVEGARLIAIVGIAHSLQRALQRDDRHVKRAATGRGHSRVHILYTLGSGIGTRGIQVDLQVAQGLHDGPDLYIAAAVDGCRRRDTVITQQPTILKGLVQIAVTNRSKGEIKTWREATGRMLSEGIADIRHKAWNHHGILVAVRQVDTAHHHQQVSHTLGRLIPPFVL